MNPAVKVVTRRLVMFELLKSKVPIRGDRRIVIARTGVAIVRTRRRQVLPRCLRIVGLNDFRALNGWSVIF